MPNAFDRYAGLVDDPNAFRAALERPLPKTVWLNPLKRAPEETAAELSRICPDAERIQWHPHAFRLPPETSPGRWLPHLLGHLYVQEEAAMIAGHLVGAQPGERILDMCAAPGGKSAQLAIDMNDQGLLVLNERKAGRMAGLRRNMERIGVTCVMMSQNCGARLPIPEVLYDRVLVDAPCSCEGTSRKDLSAIPEVSDRSRDLIVQVQKSLLRRAVKLCRPGGTILYSTCTYAPEENEAVLNSVRESDVCIEPIELPPGLMASPGLAEWEGTQFRDDVCNALRLWPHHNDTGGFFLARLRRL